MGTDLKSVHEKGYFQVMNVWDLGVFLIKIAGDAMSALIAVPTEPERSHVVKGDRKMDKEPLLQFSAF